IRAALPTLMATATAILTGSRNIAGTISAPLEPRWAFDGGTSIDEQFGTSARRRKIAPVFVGAQPDARRLAPAARLRRQPIAGRQPIFGDRARGRRGFAFVRPGDRRFRGGNLA